MKSFEAFYQAVRPSLDELERERQALTRKLGYLIRLNRWILLPLSIVSFMLLLSFPKHPDYKTSGRWIILLGFSSLGAMGAIHYLFVREPQDTFLQRFRRGFVEPLVVHLFEGQAQYLPAKGQAQGLSLGEIEQMNLVKPNPDRYIVNESIIGNYGLARFILSEQELLKVVHNESGPSRTATFWQGILLSAEWPEAFAAEIYIIQELPPYRQAGAFSHNQQHSVQPQLPLLKTQDPILERHYWIYAKDDLAKAWLEQGPIWVFLQAWLKAQPSQLLKLAIRQQRLHVMVEKTKHSKPLLEDLLYWLLNPQVLSPVKAYLQPNFNKPLNDETQVRQWYEEIRLLCDLMATVEALQKQA